MIITQQQYNNDVLVVESHYNGMIMYVYISMYIYMYIHACVHIQSLYVHFHVHVHVFVCLFYFICFSNVKPLNLLNTHTGWDDGCLSMKEGEKARFTLSSDKAYGKSGFPAWGYPYTIFMYMYSF